MYISASPVITFLASTVQIVLKKTRRRL